MNNSPSNQNNSKGKEFTNNCWNIVTSKNIIYVYFVVPDGLIGRTTCIILYPDASLEELIRVMRLSPLIVKVGH